MVHGEIAEKAVNRERFKAIAAKVIENNKILKGCDYHEFIRNPSEPSEFQYTAYKCKYCGGTVDGKSRYWYEKGLEHKQNNLF